jgi:hypothetical protein
MKKDIVTKIFSLQNIIALGTLIFGAIFWFYTINGVPKKVDEHEVRITSLEHDSIEFKTKQDLLLQAVYEIRAVLLKKNNNG